jgi:hypothetical protein
MVSIASPEELLFCDAKTLLVRELKKLPGTGNLDEAFAAWLLQKGEISFQLESIACIVAKHTGGQRGYRDVAILGFAAASDVLDESHSRSLREGLIWISGREPFLDGQLMGFCTDAIGLLGITLGAEAVKDESIKAQVHEWLNRFIKQSFESRLCDWQKCLLCTVPQLGNSSSHFSLPDSSHLADVRVALRSKGILDYSKASEEQDQIDTLSLLKREAGNSIPVARAALRLAAFNSIQQIAPAVSLVRPSIEDVSRILNRVPAALRRWTWESKPRTRGGEARKWHIDNEYHVQNFLYFLLAPIFPDLKEEDYTPSIGQMHPRADLGIPSLKLIIEVKFMRSTDKPQDMIEQIAADLSLYLVNGSSYRNIIAFIWDESCQSQEHDLLRSGLKQLPGIVDAVIMSRPGSLVT